MYRNLKNNIFKLIEPENDGDILSKIFDIIIMFFIFQSVCSVIISTFSDIPNYIVSINSKAEIVSIIVFTFEYVSRIWTADLLYPNKGKIKSRIKYITSFMALIDLAAILPFYLPFITKMDLRSLRALRLVRMLRIFKLNRYIEALSSVTNVLKRKKEQLVSSLFVVTILMIISSILVYYFEHDAQPEVFENAFSGIWWAVATLTTVGYGDIYPITVMGKMLSAFIALLGIGLVAVPTGIISAGFSEELDDKEEDEDYKYCPHCGKKIK